MEDEGQAPTGPLKPAVRAEDQISTAQELPVLLVKETGAVGVAPKGDGLAVAAAVLPPQVVDLQAIMWAARVAMVFDSTSEGLTT